LEALPRFWDALEGGDAEAAMRAMEGLLHADLEFHSALGSEVEGRDYRGLGEVREWFMDLVELLDVRYEDRAFRAVGEDVVLALYTFRSWGRGSGVETVQEVGMVLKLEDGLVRRAASRPSREESARAAEELADA
jgi:ketosteroid isomerase-like protein